MITILGAGGFIGSHIVKALEQSKLEYYAPARHEDFMHRDLGDVIYCIGLTADFRSKPFDTVAAHVCMLNDLLAKGRFSSLLYLSSTRVYIHSSEKFVCETDRITIDPTTPDDLYTLTKLTGESICLSSGRPCCVARLSNVIGAYQDKTVFLSQVVNLIKKDGHITLEQSGGSGKDYIGIDEAVPLLLGLVKEKAIGIYNIASGMNTTNQQLIDELSKYLKFTYTVNQEAQALVFPVISNEKIREKFDFLPKAFSEQLPLILEK
jgi:nucleoside-diphosphate-sugar epimerase